MVDSVGDISILPIKNNLNQSNIKTIEKSNITCSVLLYQQPKMCLHALKIFLSRFSLMFRGIHLG